MFAIEDYYTQLPGGRCYQKGGARLEKATFNCIPDYIKKHIKQNLRPKKDNGDVIVEYDMLYLNDDQMISIEIKGLNDKTSNCPDRQNKLFNQAIRQKHFLDETFSDKNIKLGVVFCFVTGKNSLPLNRDFVFQLENNGIIVSIGKTPNETIKNAINQLKLNGFLNGQPQITTKKTCGFRYVDIVKKTPVCVY